MDPGKLMNATTSYRFDSTMRMSFTSNKWLVWSYLYDFKKALPMHLQSTVFQNSEWSNFEATTLYSNSARSTLLQISLIVTTCLFILCILRNKARKTPRHEKNIPMLAIQALSAIFTPVSAAWPLPFASYFESTNFREPQNLELDILEVIEHICLGRIELRDPKDLPYLFQGKLLVYGWNVKTCIKAHWWIKTLMWTSAQLFPYNLFPSGRSEEGATLTSSTVLSDFQKTLFDLDFVSSMNLKKNILRIQFGLQPGSSVTVEFSCLATGVGFLTLDFILCAIPFLPYLSGQKKGRKSSRKSTPLFTSMQEIMALFSTGPAVITSVQNISLQKAANLRSMEKDLVDNKRLRMAHIRQVGLTGWREDRLMLLWEAGLLWSGLLTRWRMTITN